MPLAIFGIVAVILISIFLAAILLSPGAPPAIVRSATGINVQASDLGAGWSLSSEGFLSGPTGLIDYSSRSYHRDSAYGGTVYVSSTVEIYNVPANASRRFAGDVRNASLDVGGTAVAVGDRGFLFPTNKSVSLLFLRNDTVVSARVYWFGTWEDLTGRAFSSETRAAGDLLVLARILDSRI